MSTELGWGRRYLMCPARHFGVLYEINPWMRREVQADPDRSITQWKALVAALEELGVSVERIEPVPDLPDMVFTANAGVVDGNRFVPSRFRPPERAREEKHFTEWFRERGYECLDLPPGPHFEGAGDALPFGGRVLAGYRLRSDLDAHSELGRLLGVEVLPIELIDPRFYHLDLTFCPLDERRALIVPDAWDRYGREVVRRLVPEPITLETDEALAFCANSVVVDRTVVMPGCTARLDRELRRHGFEPCVVEVDEFHKAGGSVRCLTLALDTQLASRSAG